MLLPGVGFPGIVHVHMCGFLDIVAGHGVGAYYHTDEQLEAPRADNVHGHELDPRNLRSNGNHG